MGVKYTVGKWKVYNNFVIHHCRQVIGSAGDILMLRCLDCGIHFCKACNQQAPEEIIDFIWVRKHLHSTDRGPTSNCWSCQRKKRIGEYAKE